MTTGIIHEQSLEKQMGCLTGFLQIFDRHQLLTGKRLYTTKRLPPPTNGSDLPDKSQATPKAAAEKQQSTRAMTSPSRDKYKSNELGAPKSSLILPHPIFEVNEATKYSWKFSKETPRLSLDSRATFDAAKGGLRTNVNKLKEGSSDESRRCSTSVIAKLMGLESLPKQAELTRSASESSRLSRDVFQPRFNENNMQTNHIKSNVIRERNVDLINSRTDSNSGTKSSSRGFKSPPQRKSFFDSADIFPDPKQTTMSIYGEIERRMKLKGIDEQSQDLETLKQVLEAMQLKGLLHSKKSSNQTKKKNILYEEEQSHVVLMRPNNRRVSNDLPPSSYRSKTEYRRSDSIPAVSPRRERSVVDRNMKSPGRIVSSPTRSETNVRRNQLISERKAAESPEHRRVSPINSPRISPRRNGSDQTAVNRSPRSRKSTVQSFPKEKISTTFILEDGSSSTISESTVSTPSQTDTERCKSDEYREGKSLLERCDKLLHSIAEMNSTELQPSPVSVLDPSFYKDESFSPSPIMKRTISFTDESVELEEEELGSPGISSAHLKCEDEIDDSDYTYISQIMRASKCPTEEANVFLLVEKQHYAKDNSKESRLHRKLIFDITTEIIDRNKQLPPWKASKSLPRQIWFELQRIQEPNDQSSPDLFGLVCGVLEKDLAVDGWGDFSTEISEAAVLDIERLIFKDLVSESIRDLAELAAKCSFLAPCRRLIF